MHLIWFKEKQSRIIPFYVARLAVYHRRDFNYTYFNDCF